MVTDSQGGNFSFAPNTEAGGRWALTLGVGWSMGHVSSSFPSLRVQTLGSQLLVLGQWSAVQNPHFKPFVGFRLFLHT